MSLELLSQLAAEPDVGLASAAIRALGQRADGHDRWFAGMHDARPEVRGAAMFALATVVEGLDAVLLAKLEASTRPEVAAALAACRARSGASKR